ncbi:MAG: site-2 protease family protein [Planctomycetota bacterium]|jgi:Zn-dependent protease|nr:site-2 protease family protein [Planctomycetota bacterium]
MGDLSIPRIIMWLVALGFSVMFHEIMHGWVALKLGDPTAKNDGRLTFNPKSHIDPWMTIFLPLILLVSSGGSFMFGGARPVQINPMNFKNPGLGMALSAAAGPISNFFLATLSFGILAGAYFSAPQFLYDPISRTLTFNGLFLGIMIFLNILLGAFNLIPIPPLDGSRILRYVLPFEGKKTLDRMEPYGLMILLPFIFLGFHRFFLEPFYWILQEAFLSTFDPQFYIIFFKGLSG